MFCAKTPCLEQIPSCFEQNLPCLEPDHTCFVQKLPWHWAIRTHAWNIFGSDLSNLSHALSNVTEVRTSEHARLENLQMFWTSVHVSWATWEMWAKWHVNWARSDHEKSNLTHAQNILTCVLGNSPHVEQHQTIRQVTLQMLNSIRPMKHATRHMLWTS